MERLVLGANQVVARQLVGGDPLRPRAQVAAVEKDLNGSGSIARVESSSGGNAHNLPTSE
jgi:hypothetical protein